jgi:hypothetical protein
MRHVAAQFEAYMAAGAAAIGGGKEGGKGGAGSSGGFWEPPHFEEAVCCMQGMECWTGDFAAAAGRAKIVADIERLQAELGPAKELFDELNAENEREAADARALALADARDAASKLVNRINDSQKVEQRLTAALEGKEGEALAAAEKALEDAQKATKKLQEEKRTQDESFAELSQEDAEGRVGILELDLKNLDTRISDLAAETKYE